MASCSFPPSFIMLSLCTLPSLPGRELLFLSMQPATSSSCQGNKLCALLWEPCKPPPTASPPALLSHCYTERPSTTRITLYTYSMALKYGRARYVRTNTSCHDPQNSFLIPNSSTECSICQLICFPLFLNWSGKTKAAIPAENVASWR